MQFVLLHLREQRATRQGFRQVQGPVSLRKGIGCPPSVASDPSRVRASEESAVPGHALHEKVLQRQKGVGTLVRSQVRRAAVVPRINSLSTGCQPWVNLGSASGTKSSLAGRDRLALEETDELLSIYLPIYLPTYLPTYLSLPLSLSLYIYIYIYIHIYIYILIYIYIYIYI